jgi:hypothetical protein
MQGQFILLGLIHSEDNVITHLRNVGKYLRSTRGHPVAQFGEATIRKVAGSIPDGVVGFFH